MLPFILHISRNILWHDCPENLMKEGPVCSARRRNGGATAARRFNAQITCRPSLVTLPFPRAPAVAFLSGEFAPWKVRIVFSRGTRHDCYDCKRKARPGNPILHNCPSRTFFSLSYYSPLFPLFISFRFCFLSSFTTVLSHWEQREAAWNRSSLMKITPIDTEISWRCI